MKWHLTKDELPEENEPILIYVPERLWIHNSKRDIHYKVAYIAKGISIEERNKMLDSDIRKREILPSDEWGNNTVPYCFKEFGPDMFFGQEVLAWAYYEEFNKEE